MLKKNNIQKNHLDQKLLKKLSKNFTKIFKEINSDCKSEKKTLNVLSKKFKFNFHIKDLEKFKKFKSMAIIGMGGSILGADAISGFLEEKLKKKIYFFDNIDYKKNLKFLKKKKLNKILFLVISKSGETVETLSNFLSLNLIKKNAKNVIIITEKKNNYLYLLSKKLKLFFIEHKNYIGGRYSVMSEVGMVPAYLMGFNIFKLRKNLQKPISNKNKLFLKDSSLKLANLLLKNKYNNLIFLNYAPELEKFLYWCQQLIAESLGKKGKGFLPTISHAPKDHHSLLQLYLDGPKNKIFNIFSIKQNLEKKVIIKKINKETNFLDNKKLQDVKDAQKTALIEVFKQNNIPFREFQIRDLNEETLGELFSYFILETIIIGKLININPYDQPDVEKVKVLTKKILN